MPGSGGQAGKRSRTKEDAARCSREQKTENREQRACLQQQKENKTGRRGLVERPVLRKLDDGGVFPEMASHRLRRHTGELAGQATPQHAHIHAHDAGTLDTQNHAAQERRKGVKGCCKRRGRKEQCYGQPAAWRCWRCWRTWRAWRTASSINPSALVERKQISWANHAAVQPVRKP